MKCQSGNINKNLICSIFYFGGLSHCSCEKHLSVIFFGTWSKIIKNFNNRLEFHPRFTTLKFFLAGDCCDQ